jgi:hypothetical protein
VENRTLLRHNGGAVGGIDYEVSMVCFHLGIPENGSSESSCAVHYSLHGPG